MGFANFLGGLGEAAQQRNLLDVQLEHETNEHMAQALEHLAATAKDQYAPDYLNLAMQYRTLKPGQKPSKDMDLHGLFRKQLTDASPAEQAWQQQQQAVTQRAHLGPQQPQQPATPPPPANTGGFPDTSGGLPSPPTSSGGPIGSTPGFASSGTSNPLAPYVTPGFNGTTPPVQGALTPPPGQPQIANVTQLDGASLPNMPGAGLNVPAAGMPDVNGTNLGGMGTTWEPTQMTHQEVQSLAMNLKRMENQLELEKHAGITKIDTQAAVDKLKQELAAVTGVGGQAGQHIDWKLTNGGVSAFPEAPRSMPGFSTNSQGQVVRQMRYKNGDTIQTVDPLGKTQLMPDPTSPTGFSLFVVGRDGLVKVDEEGMPIRNPGATPPAAFSTQTNTTSGSHSQLTDVVGPDGTIHKVAVPMATSATTTRSRTPYTNGATPTTGGTNLPPPPRKGSGGGGASATPTGGLPGRDLGIAPAQAKAEWQNPLTAPGQTVKQQTMATRTMVDKAMQLLEPMKNDNTPMDLGTSKLLYSLGIADENSQLINAVELGRLQQAGALLKSAGGSRAIQTLNKTLVHTPGTLNSPKLMYEKLKNIQENLNGIDKSVDTEMQKYPGMKRTLSAPPSGSNSSGSPNDPLGIR